MAQRRSEELGGEGEQQQQYGRSVYAASILIGILCVAVALGAAGWKKALMLHALEVEGERIVTREDVVELSHVTSQSALFEINLAALQASLESNAFISHASVQREMPSTVRIQITERVPSAMLVLAGRNEHLYLDDEGYLLPPVVSEAIYDLPVITGLDSAQTFRPGVRTTNADILAALEILKAARSVGAEVSHLISEVRVNNGHDIVLYAFDGGTPIIFGQGRAIEKMATLDAFWKKFIVEGNVRELEYIDLRFAGQVVTLPRSAAAVAAPVQG
jgi:cell division protein FtsQ